MNRVKLAEAIRKHARRVLEAGGDPEAVELMKVLGRLVGGTFVNDGQCTRVPQEGDARDEVLFAAFGAPGDWGYGTPIGDALSKE